MATTETPGPGTDAPNRYTAIIARENSSLRRRSGVRNAAANACSTCPPLVGPVSVRTPLPPTARRLAAGPFRRAGAEGSFVLNDGGTAPGGADLLGGRCGERVGVDVDLHAAQVAGAEHLDRLATTHRAGIGEGVGVDGTALREQGSDPVEVDDLEHDLVVVLEARELGQPHVQRGLPTLEPGGRVAARTGALGAATGALALGALTAADASLGGVGARGRTQVVNLQSHSESFLRLPRRAQGAAPSRPSRGSRDGPPARPSRGSA